MISTPKPLDCALDFGRSMVVLVFLFDILSSEVQYGYIIIDLQCNKHIIINLTKKILFLIVTCYQDYNLERKLGQAPYSLLFKEIIKSVISLSIF